MRAALAVTMWGIYGLGIVFWLVDMYADAYACIGFALFLQLERPRR